MSLGIFAEQQGGVTRALGVGALLWLAYAILIVIVNGVVLDQDVVPAQIIAGAVSYPAGHPHQVYYSQVFNLPSLALAWLWKVLPNALSLSAARNCIFVFLTAYVPFALTAVLTERPIAGLVAATITLSETIRQFSGTYPILVFPNFNSDGHIGAHIAVLIVVFFLADLRGWACLLLGLLPSIHPTMAVIIWPWSLWYLASVRSDVSPSRRRRLLAAFGLGLAVCLALAAFLFITAPDTSAQPPYDVKGDSAAVFHRFVATTDMHRRPAPVWSLGYLVHPVALFALLGLLAWKPPAANRKQIVWLALLCAGIWIYVSVTALVFRATGWLPLFVTISMPARFSNLSGIMLIPLCVAAISRSKRAPLVFAALVLLQALLIPANYEHAKHYLIFAVLGAAFATDFQLRVVDGRVRSLSVVAAGAVGGALAILWFLRGETGFVAYCAAVLATLAVGRLARPIAVPRWFVNAAVLLALAVSLGIPSGAAWSSRSSQRSAAYTMQPFDRRLNDWLSANARPEEAILSPFGPPAELQVKTGHPVLMELETLYLMTYRPRLAGVIGSMARDLYGVDYESGRQFEDVSWWGRIVPGSPPIEAVWTSRSAEEWRRLARKYNFHFVLSPTDKPLHLVAVLPGTAWTLYDINR